MIGTSKCRLGPPKQTKEQIRPVHLSSKSEVFHPTFLQYRSNLSYYGAHAAENLTFSSGAWPVRRWIIHVKHGRNADITEDL